MRVMQDMTMEKWRAEMALAKAENGSGSSMHAWWITSDGATTGKHGRRIPHARHETQTSTVDHPAGVHLLPGRASVEMRTWEWMCDSPVPDQSSRRADCSTGAEARETTM